MNRRGVPTAVFAPVVDRLLKKYYEGAYEPLSERANVPVSAIDGLLRQRRETFDFDAADRILCASNSMHLWWGELADVYYNVDLSWEKCQCPGCEVTFTIEYDTLGRQKQQKYCSTACKHAAHRQRLGRAKKRIPKTRRDVTKWCRNGHPRIPENIYRFSNGTRTCRICKLEQERNRRARIKAAA